MKQFRLIKKPSLSGHENMEQDLKLFRDFEEGKNLVSTLRIYSWRPKCISVGYSQKIEDEIDIERAGGLGWEVVKRPSGGGIVFHNEAEVTYSLVTAVDGAVLPKGLIPSYMKVSEAVVLALKEIGVEAEIRKPHEVGNRQRSTLCFSYPAEYEIVYNGKKIVGSAQKRGRKALLQQGSIFVRKIEPEAFSVLKKPYAPLNVVSVEEVLGREVSFVKLSDALIKGFEACLDLNLDASTFGA